MQWDNRTTRKAKKFFTADTHFGHENILKNKYRPFKSTYSMDRILINNINKVVTPEDSLYFLGDFTIKTGRHKEYIRKIISKINGHKHLILGNHDVLKPWMYIELGFETVSTSLVLYDLNLFYGTSMDLSDNPAVRLVHDPSLSREYPNMLHLCGHIHDMFEENKCCINVGVDVRDFKPVSEHDIALLLPVLNELAHIDPIIFIRQRKEAHEQS